MESNKSFSFSFNIISEESKNKFLILPKNSHFICRNCFNVPLINFKTLSKMKYSCSCYDAENINLKDIMGKNIIKENQEEKNEEKNDNNFKNYLQCIEHNKNYFYYCIDCKENLCEDCLGNTKFHKNHNIFYFDLNFLETDIKIKYIKDILQTKLKKLKLEKVL